LRIPAH